MRMRRFRRALGFWWAATIHGVAGGWFGWGATAAAFIIGYFLHRFGVIKNIDQTQWWFLPVASAFAALLAVSLSHAVLIAPYRAWRMLNPFTIKVVSGLLESEYPTERFERQRAALAIKNKSYRQRSNCVLHIQNVHEFENQHHSFPRCIKEFSIPSGDTQRIVFATYYNDKAIMLSGLIGWGYNGNVVALPCSGVYDMELRIGIAGVDAILIFCRVWIEGDELKAAKRKRWVWSFRHRFHRC
jgi:hypothetical protein